MASAHKQEADPCIWCGTIGLFLVPLCLTVSLRVVQPLAW